LGAHDTIELMSTGRFVAGVENQGHGCRRKSTQSTPSSWLAQADESSRRLVKIPGVGPIGAVLLMLKTRRLSYSDRADSSPPG